MEFSACAADDSFGPSIQGCRQNFDFTLKFETIFFSCLPSAVLVALSIPRAVVLARRPTIVNGAAFQYIKFAAIATYAAVQLALLAWNSAKYRRSTELLVISSALGFVAAICMLMLTFLEHARSPRPSNLLNAFLLLSILFDVVQTRTLWLSAHSYDEHVFTRLFTASTAWKAVLILLESHHKESWLQWERKNHSPEESSSLYGLGTFAWLSSLFVSGYQKVLTLADLFALDRGMSAGILQVPFSRNFERACLHGQKNGLVKVLASTLTIPLLLSVPPRIAMLALGFSQVFLLQALLIHLQQPTDVSTANKGYGLMGATILVFTGLPVATAFYWYFQERALLMIRSCLAAALYRKTLNNYSGGDSAALTLMSNDIEKVKMGFMYIHEFWATPVQVAVACWLLERQLGVACVVPVIVVLFCVACSTVLMRYIGSRQMAWMRVIQRRVGYTADAICNMKCLKMSGLAGPVQESIRKLRDDDLTVGGEFRSLFLIATGIGFTPTLLVPVFTFAITFRSLDITTIFTSMSYLVLLAEPMSTLFQVMPQLFSGLTCLRRIQTFLEKEARHDLYREVIGSEKPNADASEASHIAIQISNGNFGWDKDNRDKCVLQNFSASFPLGLTIVVGPTASGKSTLCNALLGETPVAKGQIVMSTNYQRVGYCAQVPFLLNTTVRESIIGFSAVDETRYAAVVEAVMLAQDISSLPQGDQTKVGSSGVALSGGQKHRISIARALYLHCDLLIFDDVLSGLDAATEEHVFHRVFGPNGIIKERGATAILCTHSVRHLSLADHIIAIGANGSVVEEGKLDDLVANKKYVHGLGVLTSNGSQGKLPEAKIFSQAPTTGISVPTAAAISTSKRATGDRTVFSHYFRSIGVFWLVGFATFGMISGLFFNFPKIWLKYWSEDAYSPNPVHSASFYVGLYALFQCLALGSLTVEVAIGMLVIVKLSGVSLHGAALKTIITAPLSFFAKTDTGVVTNLFSQDINLIDGQLPIAGVNTSLQAWIGIGAAAVIATSSPYIVISYPLIVGLLYGIQRFYLRTSRQLRLLDLEAKSPLYTSFLDTMKGLTTFRAFGWTEDATLLNDCLLDTSQRPAYLLSMVQRWLTFVLGMVVAGIALLLVTLSVQLRSNAGFTGASMLSLMSLCSTLADFIKQYTSLETSIGAVGRLKSFSEETVSENLPGENVVPPDTWPDKGRIVIDNVSASYNDTETGGNQAVLALRDLTLTLEPGQKVAICGRTGSGKSSVVLLLLRLLQPLASSASNIVVDDLPLHTVDRSALRQRLVVMPQDTVFFPDGTSFKINLDPFAAASDDECQAVLVNTKLWAFVCDRGGLNAGMDPKILSQGQKQLFCLARAILRRRIRDTRNAGGAKGGVLILDEVSSNVDMETDRVMQDLIHREFEGYTIVMVSHRLDIVVEMFDRVLVMDAGSIVEEGAPKELMERDGSRFRDLWVIGKERSV